MQFVSLAFLSTAGASTVLAHPGHGTTDPTTVSHITEPVHVLPILLSTLMMGGLAVIGIRRLQQAKAQKPGN